MLIADVFPKNLGELRQKCSGSLCCSGVHPHFLKALDKDL